MANKKGQSIMYFEQFYQIWDKYIRMTPEKANLLSLLLSVGSKGNKRVDLVTVP